jgi:tripartite-type tricarboxylate transporter receptor subunit TctC
MDMKEVRLAALVAGLIAGLGWAALGWAGLGLAGLAPSVTPARAQTPIWPQRPVRFIVPLGPGSGADIGARLLADRLAVRWGKPVVIENRPGADGLVAIQAFVSAADDHTLLFTPSGSFTVHPLQYQKLPYVPEDLVPIARVSNTIIAMGVPTALKIGSLAEFAKSARAEAGKFNAAVVSGITEFTFDYFVKTAGLSIAKVPYRDIVQAATDLSEGRLQVMMSSYAILQPRVQAGNVRVLAVNGHERTSILPGIPTANESGFPALEVEGLVGLFGPRGISNELRQRIGADVVAVAGDPAIAERLAGTAQVPNPGGPAEFAAAIDRQRAQIATIAQALGPIPKQ